MSGRLIGFSEWKYNFNRLREKKYLLFRQLSLTPGVPQQEIISCTKLYSTFWKVCDASPSSSPPLNIFCCLCLMSFSYFVSIVYMSIHVFVSSYVCLSLSLKSFDTQIAPLLLYTSEIRRLNLIFCREDPAFWRLEKDWAMFSVRSGKQVPKILPPLICSSCKICLK